MLYLPKSPSILLRYFCVISQHHVCIVIPLVFPGIIVFPSRYAERAPASPSLQHGNGTDGADCEGPHGIRQPFPVELHQCHTPRTRTTDVQGLSTLLPTFLMPQPTLSAVCSCDTASLLAPSLVREITQKQFDLEYSDLTLMWLKYHIHPSELCWLWWHLCLSSGDQIWSRDFLIYRLVLRRG